ncbi:MAG: AbrB/MazE/SpoVT family DNA-binding domain-containing protein [Candidatus Kerfeldbacteria bacterium]|nr:AbrB/MazE/SpoVT family DNA-binding domain-containing protein [Candidatus Kerfeldbacteria bacterium]
MVTHPLTHHISPEIHGSVTVASQGQIVIPAKLRKQLGIKPGDSLIVFTKHNSIIGLIREQDAGSMITLFESHLKQAQASVKQLKKITKKKS